MKSIVEEIHFQVELESVFFHLCKHEPYAFWLDGHRIVPGLSRYSFLGAKPLFLVRTKNGRTETIWPDRKEMVEDDPFMAIQALLNRYSLPEDEGQPFPFVGGLVGYFGYELNQYAEKVPARANDPTGAPLASFMFVDQVLIYDWVEQRAYVSKLALDSSPSGRQKSEREMRQWMREIKQVSQKSLPEPKLKPVLVDLMEEPIGQVESYDSYCRKIAAIQEHIARGDIYQACFTHQLFARLDVHSFELYRVLRRINPAPFSAYIRFGDLAVASSSPERFLKLGHERRLESRPIKGTRPRGRDEAEDQSLIADLKTSEKDRAENVMIVDLVRNDFGKVCETGSVYVPALLKVESYATVHQLVSIVEGRLRKDVSPLQAIRAAFPGGSMTGAPKIRAMEILHQLEPVARGIYSGGLGYLDVRGRFDLSMVIRTLICRNGQVFFHVGGGIVADSKADLEYQESMDKAFALKKAISLAKMGQMVISEK